MTWAHYLLQVNIYLIIFYCFYKLLLNKETYFALNRLYLVSSGIFSLAIPFLRFELFSEKVVSNNLYISVSEINTVVSNYAVLPQTQQQYDWGRFIVIVYILGAFIYFLNFLYQLFTINQLFNKAGENDAFSFLNRKSVSENLPERATIDLHEDVHVKQLHSLDIIFFEIIAIVTWFNPVIYAYKKTIKNIHEYLADEAAAKFQGDKETYALLLLSQALGIKPNSLTNGFASKSLIKKRIFMLHKQRSKKIAVLKYGIFIPLFALAVLLSSASIRKNDQILAVAEKISLENAKAIVKQIFKSPVETIDIKPTDFKSARLLQQELTSNINSEFNSNSFTDFYNYIAATIKYPEAAVRKRIQGNTILNFTVKNGRIIDVIPQVELGAGCEQEIENSMISFNGSIPEDGKYSLKVAFRLQNSNSEFKNENLTALEPFSELQTITINAAINKEKFNLDKSSIETYNTLPPTTTNDVDATTENTAYNYVSTVSPPIFNGGMEKLNTFLENSIKYPISALDNEVQGVVIVNFTVEKDGSLSNIKTAKKLGFGIDEEAVRVLKLTKKWNPAMQNGKAVTVAYSIPIKFTFEQPKRASKGTIVASIRLKNYAESQNSPLFIVDGQLKAKSIMKDLDEKKIDRIDILKEANAMAKYGKKGENGAIIITSKKPENPRVSATIFE